MLKSLNTRHIVRATHSRRSDEDIKKHHYRSCYTLEPSKVVDAWDQFSESTNALEFSEFPLVLHYALIATVKKRAHE